MQNAWSTALTAPDTDPGQLAHGDLHARNVLVDTGRLTGIIDWGDLTAGDGATDLATTWMLFGEYDSRAVVLDAYQASSSMRARARGWAVFFGAILLDTGLADHPRHEAMGRATLARITEDG